MRQHALCMRAFLSIGNMRRWDVTHSGYLGDICETILKCNSKVKTLLFRLLGYQTFTIQYNSSLRYLVSTDSFYRKIMLYNINYTINYINSKILAAHKCFIRHTFFYLTVICLLTLTWPFSMQRKHDYQFETFNLTI